MWAGIDESNGVILGGDKKSSKWKIGTNKQSEIATGDSEEKKFFFTVYGHVYVSKMVGHLKI